MDKNTLIEYGRTIIVVIVSFAIIAVIFGSLFLPKMDDALNVKDIDLVDIPAETVPVINVYNKSPIIEFPADMEFIDIPIYSGEDTVCENDFYRIDAFYEGQNGKIDAIHMVDILFDPILKHKDYGVTYIRLTPEYIGKTIVVDFRITLDSTVSNTVCASDTDRINFKIVSAQVQEQ